MPDITANEAFRDRLLARQVNIARLERQLVKRLVRLVDASEAALQRKLRGRLKQLARPTGADIRRGTPAWRKLRILEREIEAIRKKAHDKVLTAWQKELKGLVANEVGFTVAAISEVLPVTIALAVPNLDFIKELVDSQPFESQVLGTWSTRLARGDRERIFRRIRNGLVQGETASNISRSISGLQSLRGSNGVNQITRNQLGAIVRTSLNFFANTARDGVFQTNSDIIFQEVYTATLDGATTHRCRALDGRRFKLGVGPKPPIHMQCRSIRVPVFDGKVVGSRPIKPTTDKQLLDEFTSEQGLRTVAKRRGLPTGFKGSFDTFKRKRIRELVGTVPAETTYGDFLRRQSKAFQEEVLGKTKAKLFRDGKLTLDKYVDRDGSELTLSELAQRETGAFTRAGLNPKDFL